MRKLRRLRQCLVHGGRQSGAQRDGVALAVLQALDAELLLGGRQSRLVSAGEHDERREVGARRQVFGELEAGARRGGIGVDAVIEHAEAVRFAQPLVLPAHIGGFAQFERKPQRIERRPPQLALAEHVAEESEAVGLLGAAGRCADRRCRPRSRRARATARFSLSLAGRICMMVRASRSHVALSFGAAATIWPSSAMPARKSFLVKAASASLADLRHRLGRRAGVGLDLRFQRDRAVGKLAVLEGFFAAALAASGTKTGATATSAAATPARTSDQIMGKLLRGARNFDPLCEDLRQRSCRGRDRSASFKLNFLDNHLAAGAALPLGRLFTGLFNADSL